MPANLDRSIVRGGVSMDSCSHMTNNLTIGPTHKNVRTYCADMASQSCHYSPMARRGIPKGSVNWYLREWMTACSVKSQAEMARKAGWSKATMSQLYNGSQDYSPGVVNSAAAALLIEPFELLMLPDEAMKLRRLRETAFQIVATNNPGEFPSVQRISEKGPSFIKSVDDRAQATGGRK